MPRPLQWLLVILALAGICSMVALYQAHQKIEVLRDNVETLESALDDAQSKHEEMAAEIRELQDKAETLRYETGRFQDENWRDVVPDVDAAAEDVAGTVEGIDTEPVDTPSLESD